MSSTPTVADHYAGDAPIERIRAQLVTAGFDLDDLDPDVLAGVDEFHLGGRLATDAIVESLDLTATSNVLDVGSGIGGAARTIAAASGCQVTGVDLTPSFVDTATELSELVGLSASTRFEVGDAAGLSFGDGEFDAVTLLHVGMNIDDKSGLFAEFGRVLRPGGVAHVYDIMRVGDGDITFPVPWSSDASTSFVETPDAYLAALDGAGLIADEPVDRLELVHTALAAAQAHPPAVNLSHLMGPEWPTMFGNLRACLQAGTLAPISIVARKALTDSNR